MVEDLVVLVRGGASEYITALAYRDLPTADLMQEWGDAVQYNPDIIKIKVQLGSCSTQSSLYSENSYEELLRATVWDAELNKTWALILRHIYYSGTCI